jgi:hypothetical protein
MVGSESNVVKGVDGVLWPLGWRGVSWWVILVKLSSCRQSSGSGVLDPLWVCVACYHSV